MDIIPSPQFQKHVSSQSILGKAKTFHGINKK